MKKNYSEQLLIIARKRNEDPHRVFEQFLDYLLDTFDMQTLQQNDFDIGLSFTQALNKDKDMFSLLTDWVEDVTKEIEHGKGYHDFFGAMYESTWKGKGKADALGQFFTPDALCQLMAKITEPSGKIMDCACGSGRTLLSAFAETDKTKFQYYEAGDIDPVSCKMCALNMMIHGMIGVVKQQDALLLTTPIVIYHINEVRYPFPTTLYSIRKEYPKREDTLKVTAEKKLKKEPKELSLFQD